MPEHLPRLIDVSIDGTPRLVRQGSVAVALMEAEVVAMRRSRHGEPRGPLCGMGICHECRVTIDGVPHQRACMTTCHPGMRIETDA